MNSLDAAKRIPIKHNVSIRVIDPYSGRIVSSHTGHNAATNSLITGIAHYLTGDGVLNQGYSMLSAYVPRYISLGTMGLLNQDETEDGLPAGIGVVDYSGLTYNDLSSDALQRIGKEPSSDPISIEDQETLRYLDYILQTPGFGADGYDPNQNNNRRYLGLGPMFENRVGPEQPTETLQLGDVNFDGAVNAEDVLLIVDYLCGRSTLSAKQFEAADVNQDGTINCEDINKIQDYIDGKITLADLGTIQYTPGYIPTVDCELISEGFPRVSISYRDIVPEVEAELPQTLDVVYSAMISTGALAQFREPDRDYIFITEAGLWADRTWTSGGDNGLLAGYRIVPPNDENWAMSAQSVSDQVAITYLQSQGISDPTEEQIESAKPVIAQNNRKILQQNILRVGINQVVQVIWKLQIGAMDQLGGITSLYPEYTYSLYWNNWE